MALLIDQINASAPQWDFVGFIGDSGAEVGKDLGGAPILGDDAWLLSQDFEADLVIGVGYPQVRAKIAAQYLRQGDRFVYPNLIHPSAIVEPRKVRIGRGNVITARTTFTCDIEVGDFNLFNLHTTVGHDVRIGSYNVLNPSVNVSGGVRMGERILLGTGSQVLENVSIQSDAIVGAGAVVRSEVLSGQTVVGIPAKPLERRA